MDSSRKEFKDDHYEFVKKFDGHRDFLILMLYIDDMLIVGRDRIKIGMLKKALSRSFSMKDMGLGRQILGMHIVRDRTKKLLWLSQEKYVTKVLQRFIMESARTVNSTLSTNNKLSGRQSRKTNNQKPDDEDTLCLNSQKPDVRNGVYPSKHRICSRSGQLIHEQYGQRALGCHKMDPLVHERHLDHVPPIRLR